MSRRYNMVGEQGVEPPPEAAYDGGGMLTEIMTFSSPWRKGGEDVLDDQIQASFRRWSQKQQLQFTWFVNGGGGGGDPVRHGQGLSLSLSSSSRGLEGNMEVCFNGGQLIRGSESDNLVYNPYVESATRLRNSRYLKGAQELLQEFCGVIEKEVSKNPRLIRNPNSPNWYGSKNPNPLSSSERVNYQRRKIKLLSMLQEVDARYLRYCQQMQEMMHSFESIAGGIAAPYTGLARKAMSRHFRGIKDAIMREVKTCAEALGEKDRDFFGLTKGETPRLKTVEKKFRQLRALENQNLALIEGNEAWRPHRGLPERSVDVLRAWLFEHFLSPYPTETDKHVLSRQTGLSKYQVSNWFINARVRLWKPMVEEMYQQELHAEVQHNDAQDEDGHGDEEGSGCCNNSISISTAAAHSPSCSLSEPPENDASEDVIFKRGIPPPVARRRRRPPESFVGSPGTRAPGDVSLTLGLRRTDNVPRVGRLTMSDFAATM
ncbi:BEL1-like homeodomain protein 4 isoform X2 [Andrographis paniculata]|uniref:BEL1-like homeodomain protein 4 isoform X2 n=1 Tax=Andrographis paniculata TaxID=175694 RepID=UPI0021E8F52C|nr:BEL1-like homeodomain protein 4 isoform X2 [Andrographis paniculata]